VIERQRPQRRREDEMMPALHAAPALGVLVGHLDSSGLVTDAAHARAEVDGVVGEAGGQRGDHPLVAAGDTDVAFAVRVRRAGGERAHLLDAVERGDPVPFHRGLGLDHDRDPLPHAVGQARPVDEGGEAGAPQRREVRGLPSGAPGDGQLVEHGRDEVVPCRETGASGLGCL
jgi:hypothetical protein